MSHILFHLAFPVSDINQTKEFYVEGLGCGLGRENLQAVILNLYGHQLVAHLVDEPLTPQKGIYPRHFGLVFTDEADWEALLQRVQQKQLALYQQPKHRFINTPLEHRTFFLADPFSNLMEFKFYTHHSAIFGATSEQGDREYAQIGDRA